MTLIILSLVFFLNIQYSYSSYEYLKLAQQWPKSYCYFQIQSGKKTCNSPIPLKFTIHGLWPSNTSTSAQPKLCPSNNQSLNQLTNQLESQLKLDWPNLSGKDDDFWKHEWTWHGTCSENKISQPDYFLLALNIKRRSNLKVILANANIIPSKINSYSAKSIINTISGVTKSDPQLSCYYDSRKKVYNLQEIRLCLVADGTSYINCSNPFGNCNGHRHMIYWPI
uniref:Ribonuclease 3 n=1 Tax=Cajanus cajan TaxID=3821 RepID=A0A151RDI2_CAJCA|nr:Ribonuclease 3 [Cajanus cajan]